MRLPALLTLLLCRTAFAAETYEVHFGGDFDPEQDRVEAVIEVEQSDHKLRVLDFAAPAERYDDFRGDGEVERDGDRLIWRVPPDGGRLRYTVEVDHKRNGSYDARLAGSWAILRLDDLFPAARVVSLRGAESVSTLDLEGPRGWTFESRYGKVDERLSVDNPDRRFDRPTGWLAAGRLGVRREWIGERRIVVAGPQGHDLRRLDIIAFLRWTLPRLARVFPDFPRRLLIVGARDGMWHGGLSGPASVYLHSERPLLSENGTSALLHELVHVATGGARGRRVDWIVEGLAEFYSLEILRRSGGLGIQRYRRAFDYLSEWARREHGSLASPSTGADTARAALLFHALHTELAQHDDSGLDAVVRHLLDARRIDVKHLRAAVEEALGGPSATLDAALGKP